MTAGAEGMEGLLHAFSSALEEGNAARFLATIDRRRCPGYAALEDNVVALLAQNSVGSSIGITGQTRQQDSYELKLDWLLQIRPAGGARPAVVRRQTIRCRIERSGKGWKVTALEPAGFFRP